MKLKLTNKKFKKIILFSVLALAFFLQANYILALEIRYPSILGFSIDSSSSLPEYAKYFFNIGMAIAGVLTVMVIIFGGLYYLVSLGRGGYTGEGKEWIKAGITGLLLIISSYLIAYTINPYLVIFDFKGLAPISFLANYFNPPPSPLPVEIYSEIPIGTLTENLLAGTTDCYNYDGNGDPIEGDQIETDNYGKITGPTYLEHDRIDCFLKLGQAAEKKAKIVNTLSNEITNLMNQCNCGVSSPPLDAFFFSTTYAHMDKIYVTVGQNLNKGDIIGEVGKIGTTGTGAYPHIHFGAGLINPAGIDAISFDIYSSISAPNGSTGHRTSGAPGPMPAPNTYTQDQINYILRSLLPPVSLSYCNWTEVLGSFLHSGYAYWAQDWKCPLASVTDRAPVMSMAGGINIKSTVVSINPSLGNVIIRHDYTPSASTPTAPSTTDCKTNCNDDGKGCTISGTSCTGDCVNGACKSPEGRTDCCPAGVKDKIEKGPIKIPDCNGLEKEYKGLDEFRSQFNNDYNQIKNFLEIQPPPKIKEKSISVIKKVSWQDLRLIDQLTYLKGKLDEISSKAEQDLKQLQKAESSLGKCYLADTYIDFLKIYEQTNKADKTILIEKSFLNSETNQLVNPAKYCQGFQYNNSSCYSQCQKICPGTEQSDFDCYRNVTEIDKVKECFDNRKCIPGASSFETFKGCFSNCKQQCLDSCNTVCLGDDKKKCQEKCDSNSQCLLNNEDKCLMNFNQLKDCSNSNNDLNFLKNCADNATLCKYCSDQYAGYPECLKSPYSLQDKYSSSFIYQHPNYQICAEPYKTIVLDNNVITNCLNLYPETAKCPSASKCPKCPCAIISNPATENKVCSGECDNFAYNDDPLTFYCQQSWWLKKEEIKDTEPIGSEKICPKEREIPVGRTIDDAEKWGQDLITSMSALTQKVQDMVQYMKNIGQKKDYCACDSKCEDNKLICHTDCQYKKEKKITVTNPDTGKETTITIPPSCSFVPCNGKPCQLMIDLLQGAIGDKVCAQGKGIEYYYNQIAMGVKDFMLFITAEKKSDVLKELSYSRKKTNECSVVQNNYGIETRTLSCTRVEDEILSPITDNYNKTIVGDKAISSYCYGKALGEILKTPAPMADNWFCCENRTKEQP